MQQAVAGDECAIANDRVPADQGAISDDDLVADLRIVTHMAMGHEESAGTDRSGFGRGVGTVHGDVFTEDVIVPDEQRGWRSAVFEILGCIADDTTGVEDIAGAAPAGTEQVDVRPDPATGPECHARLHHAVRADRHRAIQNGIRMDESCGMDHSMECSFDSLGFR